MLGSIENIEELDIISLQGEMQWIAYQLSVASDQPFAAWTSSICFLPFTRQLADFQRSPLTTVAAYRYSYSFRFPKSRSTPLLYEPDLSRAFYRVEPQCFQ